LTRGKGITQRKLQAFVSKLDLPATDKARLMQLTPQAYTGLAERLVKTALKP
jgi:adenylosuccinate lyase